MAEVALEKNITLLDLLDRILDKGMIVGGDLTISVAGVDLVYVGLRALASSVETLEQRRGMRVSESASPDPADTQTHRPADPWTRRRSSTWTSTRSIRRGSRTVSRGWL